MTTKFLYTWKRRASRLKMDAYTIYLAYKDPRVSWYAKILIACVIGYAFSPIDKFLNSIPHHRVFGSSYRGSTGCCLGIQKDNSVRGLERLPRNGHVSKEIYKLG
jgi:hypothetical protein